MLIERINYKEAENPPPPITWEKYEELLIKEWNSLLNSEKQNDENVFQEFLEINSCLLPRPFNSFNRGADIIFNALFSKPELPGINRKIPDFMWITIDSVSVIVVLIEIEAPSKCWFNQNGSFNSRLYRAVEQVRDWKSFFQIPENVMQFKRMYKLNKFSNYNFEQRYILIYGRREEAELYQNSSMNRKSLQKDDEIFMTYDRLYPDRNLNNCPTVKIDRSDSNINLRVCHVPPTFTLGPGYAEDFSLLKNREDAINENTLISEERKIFLIKRLKYWDSWAEGYKS